MEGPETPSSAEATHGRPGDLCAALAKLSSISLSEMDGVTLLNRIDTKYVFPRSMLLDLLERLSTEYRVLEIGGARIQHYQTLYFDTEDAEMYRMHHNGRARRMKVRKRWYVGSDLAFLEIKRRNNKKRTVKSRIRLPGEAPDERTTYETWAEQNVTPYRLSDLCPRTWTRFNRITLVDRAGTERVTLDADICWSPATSGEEPPDESSYRRTSEDFCIAELKRDGRSNDSLCMKALRESRVLPSSFSKYALGSALIHPHLKQGGFKPTLRKLGGLHHD